MFHRQYYILFYDFKFFSIANSGFFYRKQYSCPYLQSVASLSAFSDHLGFGARDLRYVPGFDNVTTT